MFEARVYPRGESQTPAKFRRACRLVAAALHPEHLEAAHAEAKKQTDVTKWVEDAGMASLRLLGSAPVINEIWDHVNTEAHAQARAAKKAGEEWVPIGERRIAVFTRLARTGDAHLRGLGITRDGADAFDPTQDDRDPADVTALLEEQVEDGTDLEHGVRTRHRGAARSGRASRSSEHRGHPGRGQQAREPEPARTPDRTSSEGPARGDHRPRRRPRRQRRTSDPRGLRTDPRLHRPGARR